MHPAIAQHRAGIFSTCEHYRIRRLDIFEWAARQRLDADNSDANFLAEFELDAAVGLDAFFSAKAALVKLTKRGVDLIESGAIRNPFVLASINRSRESVDAA